MIYTMKEYKLSEETYRKAIKLLIPDIPKNKINVFYDAFQEEYSAIHCIVKFKFDNDFILWCHRLGLYIGDREVVINDDGKILFTNDYRRVPMAI